MRYGCAKALADCEFCSRRATMTLRDPEGALYRSCALCCEVQQGVDKSPWNDHRACNGGRNAAA